MPVHYLGGRWLKLPQSSAASLPGFGFHLSDFTAALDTFFSPPEPAVRQATLGGRKVVVVSYRDGSARVIAVRTGGGEGGEHPAREQIQQNADRATYERRALAVERERAIAENELQNQIELARREEQVVAPRGANARRQAEEAAPSSSHSRAVTAPR